MPKNVIFYVFNHLIPVSPTILILHIDKNLLIFKFEEYEALKRVL